ncbi:MAG: hypothetical protein LBU62_01320, partial [Bacteroidales bacterium]|nr:hypothetical protein [Bacteroidales bacterium]
MKTILTTLLIGLVMMQFSCLPTQKTVYYQSSPATSSPATTVVVETHDDISYHLDLRAVASIFADSRNLEDFEYRLNSNNSISNLDLNNDGFIDYLRVVESFEKSVHVIIIQSALSQREFQDVATIVVDNKKVQIIGDPYIYGTNYVIVPVYHSPPVIYTTIYAPHYVYYRSPYYGGYYPAYYHTRPPVHTNVYVTNVNVYVNNNHRYTYTTKSSSSRTVTTMRSNISRRDYSTSHPQQSFVNRNSNARNTQELQTRNAKTTSNSTRSSTTTGSSSRTSATQSSPSRSSSAQPASSSTTRSSSSSAQPASSSS